MPSTEARPGWSFWIDRGGTFTDIVARPPAGPLVVRKLLSQDPDRYDDAAVAGIAAILAEAGETLAAARIEAVKMGTTVATNALLERRGEPTLLVITRGFADALEIGYQNRPRLFDLEIRKPAPLYADVMEVDERLGADGRVLRPLDLASARARLLAAYDRGLRAAAIVLMHGYRHADHERALARLAREVGFTQVSVSHEVSALIKLVGRGETTVADAYLSPALARYVEQVADALPAATRLMFMQSSGGLTEAGRFRGADAVLSGPAGGVVGMARTAREAGFERVIGFDMGGTSTDVSHFAGEYERTGDGVVGGVRLCSPMLAIHTVAAGGGSICRFDGARLRVGPASAGARPGPACYRGGGPLTITDCNLALGKIRPEHFPAVFGPAGDQPLDLDAAIARLDEAAEAVRAAGGRAIAPLDLAEGFIHIAVEAMAKAVKQISVERGYDLARYALVSFGGAGGQHAGLVADALGIDTVMIHPLAGVLSAYGMGCADVGVLREATVEARLQSGRSLEPVASALEDAALAALDAQALPFDRRTVHRRARLKYEGTDTALQVDLAEPEAMRSAFEDRHRRRFGFIAPDTPLVVEALSVEALGQGGFDPPQPAALATDAPPTPLGEVEVRMDGADRRAPVFERTALAPGMEIDGPAVIVEAAATTAVEPGWRARVDGAANLILTRIAARAARTAPGTAVDPIRLELFNNLFMAVAEEMGAALQSTAYSVNIKERLDFSCALFDRAGALIANAPHIPVHLGSMGASVQAVMAGRAGDGRGIRPGDVYMLNAPYNGGTHLPDVTVIMPVFVGGEPAPLFWVAARGHHADIGGITPGSMPPASRSVLEEGVLIDDFLLVEADRLREAEVRDLLGAGRWPARNPDQNLGDLKAQVAACARGADALRAVVAEHGLRTVEAYMGHVQDNAEEAVRRVLAGLDGGGFSVEMDSGAVIAVRIAVDRAARSAVVDFTGTSPQQADNFNAPLSVSRAALLYVLRTLVKDEIPLNDGCLRPVRLVVPEGSMLSPLYPAAVVAGNVETSQAIVDALYGALGVMAAAQGSMNNLTFGDGARQYYETIAGGSGAGPGFAGADAVQTHMTNSRLTDPEVLEARFPVLVEGFAIRRGSGGEGAWRGGDGVVRRLRFLEPMTAAILSNRRRMAPFGLAGGGEGACGRNTVERRDGAVEDLGSTGMTAMAAGETLVIETPGGGGYGEASAGTVESKGGRTTSVLPPVGSD